MKTIVFDTVIGTLAVTEHNGKITRCQKAGLDDLATEPTPLLEKAKKQLEEYFVGKRKSFDLPLDPAGTEFQKTVWNTLLKIPYGQTCSYKAVADRIGRSGSARAVGGANNKNPILIFIPCHRVVGHNGNLVGYAAGLSVKEQLLALEQSA